MGNQQTTQSSTLVPLPTLEGVNKAKPSSFDPKHPTGEPLIDTGAQGACADQTAKAGCYLSEKQRIALVIGYSSELDKVSTQCHLAIQELEIEQLVKNVDELPWLAGMLLSALAALLTEGLSTLIESGVGLATSVAVGAEAIPAIDPAIANVSISRMRDLIEISMPQPALSKPSPAKAIAGKVVDPIKQAMTGVLGKSSGGSSDAAKQKAESVGYLQFIDRALTAEFNRLGKVIPGEATDAELLVLYKYFDPDHHPKEMYRERFRALLERYLHSNVSKIGRRVAWDERRGDARVELETRVAWLITKGAGRRLIYVDRAFSSAYERLGQERRMGFARSGAYDAGTHQLSLQQDATWMTPLGEQTRHETPLGPDLMLNYVEPEFVDVALAAQEQVWLAPPETFMMDYSFAPPRMVKVAS